MEMWMIKVWHISDDFGTERGPDRELRLDAQMTRDEDKFVSVIKALIAAPGSYLAVANVEIPATFKMDTWALEYAMRMTSNDLVPSGSWSQEPPVNVTPLGQSYHVGKDGQHYGRKSSYIGDVFEMDGRFYAVATFGFTEIDGIRKDDAAVLEVV
jgi:hypothetical protein